MISLTAKAQRQLTALRQYYEDQDRPEATQALIRALTQAIKQIENDPTQGLPAPRPYPHLARLDRLWIKAGRYWIAYEPKAQVIVGVFFETATIPDRL